MSWVLIGTIAGTLIAQPFDTREACEGRAVILREQKASTKCAELAKDQQRFTTSAPYCCGSVTGICGPC